VTAEPPDDGALGALVEVQGVLIEVLEARNASLEGQNAALRERLAEAEDRLTALERVISRNSGNSSMPPSADDLPGRKSPDSRRAGGGGKRRPGKQPGAPGAHLAWNQDPDERVPLFPQGPCSCGQDLAGAADLGIVASRQVWTCRWPRRR
jgi:hypothetical protein